MQANIILLAKRAVNLALKQDWTGAIEINKQIIEKDSKNIDAMIRLGRAYMQTKDATKALKVFKDVLKLDPINQVAKKNLELLNGKKLDLNNSTLDAKSLIKEPGTTAQINLQITSKGISSEDFTPGEILESKIKKTEIDIIKNDKKKTTLIGVITITDIVKAVNLAINKGSEVMFSFIKGNEKTIQVLVKTDIPVFRSEKQDIKPYFKEGLIGDPDMENEEEEVVIEPEE